MYLAVVVALAVVFGGLSLYISIRIMRRFSWFFSWIRGTIGLAFLTVGIAIIAVAYDLSHYEELLEEKAIASLTFKKLDEQKYEVDISFYSRNESTTHAINGDQWQVDARIVRWNGLLGRLGAKPGYRLDRISGRYFSLEDENAKERTAFPLGEDKSPIDVWKLIQDHGELLPLIDAQYGSAAYLPMADKATFQLSLSHNGLTAKPLNDMAKDAINYWK